MNLETHTNIDGARSLPFVSFGSREGDPGGGSAGGGKKPTATKKGPTKKTGGAKTAKKNVKRK